VKLERTYPTFSTGMATVDKLTFVEALVTALLGITCLLARSPMHASKTNGNSIRIERLRRSRWQWFSMVVLLFLLRIQNVLPAKVELVVGLQFLIFLVLPIRILVSGNRGGGLTTSRAEEHALTTQCAMESMQPEAVDA